MPDATLETTVMLLNQAKGGDSEALNQLVARALPPLRRWARGRLPQSARSLAETQDLVQDVVMRTLPRLDTFEVRRPGALQAFLRQSVSNHIIDEIRKARRRPAPEPLTESAVDAGPSPLEHAIGAEARERYEEALTRLTPTDRGAIRARVEKQQSYEEVAAALGKPNANAARMTVLRAIRRLVKIMARLP
jgi:RNA polymerase sigma-70 factor (ECF subfamily)